MNDFNEERSLRFPGWWMVGGFFIITALTSGIVTTGFTAFFEPLATEFRWSYTQISAAASLRGIEVGLLAPLMGILIDRWGPRPLVLGGILAIGGGLVLFSHINSLGMYYLSFILISVGISGPSVTVAAATMANWFPNGLGTVMGIIGSGFALGGLLVPLVVRLIEATDWRKAVLILGIGLTVICLPLASFLRFRTEKPGPRPAARTGPDTPATQAPVPVDRQDVGTIVKQVLLSRTFWHIALAVMIATFVMSTISTHIMPYLSTMDFTRSTASLVVSAAPLISIASRLGSGWFADRYNTRMVAIGSLAVLWLGILCLNFLSGASAWIIVPYLLFYGTGWGGIITMRAPLIREYFGRKNYGTIFGFMQGITVLSLLGPIFAGWVFDTWSNYRITWQIYMVLIIIAIIIVATIPSPRRRPGSPPDA